MTTETTTTELRFCSDIGMFAWDRPRRYSCIHRTSFCNENCYNVKLENFFKQILPKDDRNESWWQQATGAEIRTALDRKRNQTKRIRGCTRGENFRDHTDIDRMHDILKANRSRQIWLPTRAWRNPELRQRLETEIMNQSNARLQASIDPSNTIQEVLDLWEAGWSLMYFGNDEAIQLKDGTLEDLPAIKCKKTWEHKDGHCAKCIGACFSKKQTLTWLKKH